MSSGDISGLCAVAGCPNDASHNPPIAVAIVDPVDHLPREVELPVCNAHRQAIVHATIEGIFVDRPR